MEIVETELSGCYCIECVPFRDNRGGFTKYFQNEVFKKFGINFIPKEQYFTTSKKNVLRGMHFQSPPHDHDKLVICVHGRMLDVVIDLRVQSSTYGQFISVELSPHNGKALFIPSGFAHGFLSLETNSIMAYSATTVHSSSYDTGIRWDSFGFNWPCENAIVSKRDQQHPSFGVFESPFIL